MITTAQRQAPKEAYHYDKSWCYQQTAQQSGVCVQAHLGLGKVQRRCRYLGLLTSLAFAVSQPRTSYKRSFVYLHSHTLQPSDKQPNRD